MREGGGNCLKYLEKGGDTNILKRGGQGGSSCGHLRMVELPYWEPTNLSSNIHFSFLLTYSPETVKSIIILHET